MTEGGDRELMTVTLRAMKEEHDFATLTISAKIAIRHERHVKSATIS